MNEFGRKLLKRVYGKKQNVVAVALRKGKVLSVGYNSYSRTHPFQKRCSDRVGAKKPYLHAEIAALIKCRKTPDTLWVFRANKKGELCIAKPCEVCQEAIRLINPEMKVFHT